MKTFIEIGAADFDTMLDTSMNWRGVICEPHPVFYKRLIQKCTNPNITILDLAVSDKNGQGTMEFPTEKYINETENNEEEFWTRGVGGFRIPGFSHKLDNARNAYNRDESYVEERTVYTISLDQLVANFGITQLDFLKIDTEGHDVVILEGYSWRIKPTFIKCEHGRHNNPDILTERMEKVLTDQGYKYWIEDWDIYGVLM